MPGYSYGQLTATRDDQPVVYTGAGNIDPPWSYGWSRAYAMIYATQPAVRTCVDFLARNIAQLGLQVFRRISDTDRVRLTDHPLADWIEHPNPYTTRYRLIESLVGDLAIYFNAYLLKMRLENGRIGLVRLPAGEMCVEGGLLPEQFVWTVDGQRIPFATSEIIYFNGYNPLNALEGLSPLETLRKTLSNDAAATDHRERYWLNASRMEGVVERPLAAPKWEAPQKQMFVEQWRARFTGPQSTGQVALLDQGMQFKPISWSAKDSEYTDARKLTREEVAAEYHIPLPMVGILDHATFSNIREQHKQLYADTLGPWLEMLQAGFELQLVPEVRDAKDIYLEFNIAAKLAGSFEEQANAIRLLVGRPVMTPNEARGRLNLPRMADDPSADEIAAQQGGPAAAEPSTGALLTDGTQATSVVQIIRGHQDRQRARLQKVPAAARVETFRIGCADRWTRELAADLTAILGDRTEADQIAALVNADTLGQLEREG
jgi:HK97 family phage portal protein